MILYGHLVVSIQHLFMRYPKMLIPEAKFHSTNLKLGLSNYYTENAVIRV